ncbi:9388_t:CDS:1 [Acaulospora morrowiae]|uniref:9388_t:CDS:1 n=1 Tax=Acaulospora morrowiae TaxID=94023 RepID=A0A9N9DA47_9GLOM|nr:9388_t:CDS:1 [Acaulospora morrowiae]
MLTRLPEECLLEIFKNFAWPSESSQRQTRANAMTLRSCTLVSRQWCRISIPLLWEQPFNFVNEKRHYVDLINTYFECLDDAFRRSLEKYKIPYEVRIEKLCDSSATLRSKRSQTAFDYISFLKSLNIIMLHESIVHWTSNIIKITEYLTNTTPERISPTEELTKTLIPSYIIEEKLFQLFLVRSSKLVELSYNESERVILNYKFCPNNDSKLITFNVNLEPRKGGLFSLFSNFSFRSSPFGGMVGAFSKMTTFQAMGNTNPLLLNNLAKVCKSIRNITIYKRIFRPEEDRAWSALIFSQDKLRYLKISAANSLLPSLTNVALERKLGDLEYLELDPMCFVLTSLRDPFIHLKTLRISMNLFPNPENPSSWPDSRFAERPCLNRFEPKIQDFVPPYFSSLHTLELNLYNLKYSHFSPLTNLIKNTNGTLRVINIFAIPQAEPESDAEVRYLVEFNEMIVMTCPNLIEFQGPLAQDWILRMSEFFMRCPSLEFLLVRSYKSSKLEINIIERDLFNEGFVKMGQFVPRNLKHFSLPVNYEVGIRELEIFLIWCERRSVNGLSLDFVTGMNNVKRLLNRYASRGVLNQRHLTRSK